VARHDGANRGASGKKEIGHINLVFVMVLSNGISILVHQPEIGNGMVFFYMLKGAVHQFGTHVIGLVHFECPFWGKHLVNCKNDDGREYQHDDSKEFVFGKEFQHLEILNKGTASKKITKAVTVKTLVILMVLVGFIFLTRRKALHLSFNF